MFINVCACVHVHMLIIRMYVRMYVHVCMYDMRHEVVSRNI